MNQWTKRTAVMLMAGSVVATGLTGCGSKAVDNNEVVATVNGEDISYGVANFSARMDQASVEYYYESMMGTSVGAEMWTSEVGEGLTYEDSVKENIMESIQNLYLIRQHAEEYGVELTEEEQDAIEKAVTIFEEDNALEDKELISGEEVYVKEFLELMTFQKKMEEPMQDGYDANVSDEEAAQKKMSYVYFSFNTTDADGNSVEMTDDEKAELKTKAENFATALKSDSAMTMDALSVEYEVEVSTVTFDSELTAPNADLIAAADAFTAEGEVTDVIEAENGYYVGQLTSLFDEEATATEKASIIEERKNAQYTELLESWKEEAEVTVNDEVWEKVDFETVGVSYKDSSEEYDDTAE